MMRLINLVTFQKISSEQINTKDFLRLGVPLGQATRRATDFISKFMLGGGGASGSAEFIPLHLTKWWGAGKHLCPAGVRELKRRERRVPCCGLSNSICIQHYLSGIIV